MKPLEITFRKTENGGYEMIVFYDNGKMSIVQIEEIPDGFKQHKHYSITDIYGYEVKDDREGL